ncbi:hypothetical protein GF339_14595 [candidate division KSB3 bacterium]|uniref:Uncharacterized protein n=1 Tax=candidate division KSB3 bacterium TaxID=2044937 RepID=A0A9D5JY26_9BACT|nr:hypothetical protein [candidate division KSB3 bacterium]MBD3325811.1 hypothetical protein [candidate division KSB3 bacterium]
MYTQQDCIRDTTDHIDQVKKNIHTIITQLHERAAHHDESKLSQAEIQGFTEYTPKLKNSVYGSEEYRTFLEELKPILEHHYQHNRHHPEHFENGYRGMNLVDLIEMFCDWLASTQRQQAGDIYQSIQISQQRFGLSDDLVQIFINTAKDVFHIPERTDQQ